MVAKFDLNDDSVVVIVGTGAGGGVLANELAQKGVKVVALEAGGRYLPEDYVNDEWDSFGQLAWTDPRTTSGDWRVARDFPTLPAWIVKAVGGTTTHWAGASLRFQDHEWKALSTYGAVDGASLDFGPFHFDQDSLRRLNRLFLIIQALVGQDRPTLCAPRPRAGEGVGP